MQSPLTVAVLLGIGGVVVGGRAGHPAQETLEPSAVQSIYQDGVPHTDAQGDPRTRYDSASFFPRCLYHALPGSLTSVKAAGFNCVHTWEGVGVADVIQELRSAELQLIMHSPGDEEVRRFKSDPHILGWYLDEEPTGHAYEDGERGGNRVRTAARYATFVWRKAAIKALDPSHPIFPLDIGPIPPGMSEWWDRWNSAGDVSAHDHYLLGPGTADIESLAGSVLRAVRLNGERKPVWITLQAFGALPGLDARLRIPTAAELRGMAFTAIVHGATGIILFAYDSRVTRQGHVLGISPVTPERYDSYTVATTSQAAESRALWAGAAALNAELARLTPRLLSPTSRLPYEVGVSGERPMPSPIRTMLKEQGGGFTLLAANLEGAPMKARFQFRDSLASVRRVNADGSVTVLTPEGAGFRDVLGAFGAAVYELTLARAESR